MRKSKEEKMINEINNYIQKITLHSYDWQKDLVPKREVPHHKIKIKIHSDCKPMKDRN